MRLIDADKLNVRFEDLKKGTKRFTDLLFLDAAQAVVDSVPTIERADEWISVDDRLPECGEIYLIATGFIIKAAYLDGAHKWVDDGNTVLNYVTHWKPLPTPPKEETDA